MYLDLQLNILFSHVKWQINILGSNSSKNIDRDPFKASVYSYGPTLFKKIILGEKITRYSSNFVHSNSFLEGDEITSIPVLDNFVTPTKLKNQGLDVG